MESTVVLFCGCLLCIFDSFEAVFEWNQLLNYFVDVYCVYLTAFTQLCTCVLLQ